MAQTGSILFAGNQNSNLLVPYDQDLVLGTEDFTIEWFQFQTSLGNFPRVFQIGYYGNSKIGVSIEANRFYLWLMNSSNANFSLAGKNYIDTWVHFAGTYDDDSKTLKTYVNGVLLATRVNTPSTNYGVSTHKISGTNFGNGGIKGNVQIVRHYNRALTSSEILQNYNAQKGRFGL